MWVKRLKTISWITFILYCLSTSVAYFSSTYTNGSLLAYVYMLLYAFCVLCFVQLVCELSISITGAEEAARSIQYTLFEDRQFRYQQPITGYQNTQFQSVQPQDIQPQIMQPQNEQPNDTKL